MKAKLKFGKLIASMTGGPRSRTVALFDYTTVPAGHLIERVDASDIAKGRKFAALTDAQNKTLALWAKPKKGGTTITTSSRHKAFPSVEAVLQQFYLQSQKTGSAPITYNEDGEMSHPAVTAWYVAKYCRDNHLTV